MAAEHNILENVTPLTWRPVARPIYSGCTVAVRAGDLVMSSSLSRMPWAESLISARLIGCVPLFGFTEKSTMTATDDAYRLSSFGSMVTGYRLTPDVDGRCSSAIGLQAALRRSRVF